MRRLTPLLLVVALLVTACGDDTEPTDVGGPAPTDPTTNPPTTTEVVVVPTTSLDPASPEAELARARERWAENGLASYRMTTKEICFCVSTEWTHTVVDGEEVDREPADPETSYDPGPRSMETLFDEIEAIIADGYASLEVDYDPTTGAVERYYADIDVNMADEEHGVEVTSLAPHDPDVPTVDVDAAALVDDYPCGYGFAKGDAGQHLSLLVHWRGGFDPEGPDVSAPVILPNADWEALIQIGDDLFANWCDDVIEVGEPTPVVTETWQLVAGTLTVDADGPAGSEKTATLTGAIAESPTGEQVPLGDVALANSCYGCFAG